MFMKRWLSVFALAGVCAAVNESEPLLNYGILLFPAFQAIDVFGPLDILNMLSLTNKTNLYIVADSMEPVSTRPLSAAMNKAGSSFNESIVPTHTFASPPDLDVLIVPGGLGSRAPDPQLDSAIDFISKSFAELKYLFVVCTGATLAARSGVLDGHRATTNKRSWNATIAWGPNVDWVPHARWVDDGKVWTTSGLAAGIDGMFAFVSDKYSEAQASSLAIGMEYERHLNASWDPFADYYGLS